MTICCAICFAGVTWAWFSSSTAVKTADIVTANYETELVVTDQNGNVIEPVDGKYDFDRYTRYTVTITASGTASTGFATFEVNGSSYHSVQLAPGESISFDIFGYTPLVTGDSNWGTSSSEDPVFDEDTRFIKETVKLVPVDENSMAMIERNGIVETYNKSLVSTPTDVTEIREADLYTYDYSTDDYESYYVYGLDTSMGSDSAKLDTFVKVNGDGYYTLTLSEADMAGTGAVIKVYDRMGTEEKSDDTLVEQFYIVIFGDVDGDSFITGSDATMVKAEVNRDTSWSRDNTRQNYIVKAADVDCDTFITGSDSTMIKAAVNRVQSIDQKTCAAY